MAPGSPVVTYANISVDADGNFSCVSGSTNDPDGKIAKQNSKDKVQNYYEELCKKFPQININKNGGVIPGNANKATVNISQACLEKMANDPEFAAKIEWNLSGEAAAHSLLNSWAQRDGVILGGPTVTYDADGNRESSCGGMRTANTGNSNNIIGIQNKYKKEWEEKLKELREKNKEKYEELVEKIKNGSYDEKSGEFEFKIHGTDIDGIIKQIEEKYSAGFNLSSNISSYDIKV